MTVSRFTSSAAALYSALVTKLTDAGYAFNRSTKSIEAHVVTALNGLASGSATDRTKGFDQALQELAVAAGASANRLVDTELELIARIINGTFGGGGTGDGFQLEDASGVLLLESGDILLLEA